MTSFDTVIDLALTTVADYKLQKLYSQDQDDFLTFCDGLLIRAVPNFYQCKQSLEYDAITREFSSELSALEVSILADFWVIEWIKI